MTYIIIVTIIIIAILLSSKEKETTGFGRVSEHVSIFNKGFCLLGGFRAITREQSYRNALITGNTGSGKTSAILIGSLFTLSRSKASIVILDVSGEIFNLSSGYLSRKKNRTIYCFDLSENSDGFNLITLCKNVDDLNKVAHVLVKNGKVASSSDPYWSASSAGLHLQRAY